MSGRIYFELNKDSGAFAFTYANSYGDLTIGQSTTKVLAGIEMIDLIDDNKIMYKLNSIDPDFDGFVFTMDIQGGVEPYWFKTGEIPLGTSGKSIDITGYALQDGTERLIYGIFTLYEPSDVTSTPIGSGTYGGANNVF